MFFNCMLGTKLCMLCLCVICFVLRYVDVKIFPIYLDELGG